MTVKGKLFSIVFGELIMFLLIIGIAALSFVPILTLNSQFTKFSELEEQVLVTQQSISGLYSEAMELQYYKIIDQKKILNNQFEVLSEQTELISINDKIESAVDVVLQLSAIFNSGWEQFEPVLLELLDFTEDTLSSRTMELTSLYHADTFVSPEDHDLVMLLLDDLVYRIKVVDRSLKSAYSTMKNQDEIIQAEMNKNTRGVIIRTAAIFLAFIAVIIIVSIIIASKMAKSITALSNGVSLLREGRLNVDFNTSSKDDIAILGGDLNEFTRELSKSIEEIKRSSQNNLRMKDELSTAADDSQSSSEGIKDAVVTIRDGMVDLDERVAESGVAVTTVKTRTEELKGMLEEQTAMIEESTSSVTEMIASITNVSDITGRKKAATDELVKTAEKGGTRLEQTINVIKEITANVDDIHNTASLIQSVAAQTNLLAMNAAIEAAHAGKAGAGFSVVAEEIRKLAEASGVSSKRIGTVLKEVVANIEDAAASGDETKKAFSEINSEIVEVAGAFMEINHSMDELSAGGSQILSAMNSLQGFASGVKDGGDAMSDAAASLEEAFRIVERVSSGVLSQIGGIGDRIEEISRASGVVTGISGRLSAEAEQLASEVERFTLGEEVGSAEPTGEDSVNEDESEDVLIDV